LPTDLGWTKSKEPISLEKVGNLSGRIFAETDLAKEINATAAKAKILHGATTL
jgi:hypothetical protein